MPSELHESTFEYLAPSATQKGHMEPLRKAARAFADVLEEHLPDGADKTYCLRKLREIAMWANVCVMREHDGKPRC